MVTRAPMSRLWRLTPAIALATAITLLIAGLLLGLYNERAYRDQKIDEATVQARILASTVTAALAFSDRDAAQDYVAALRANPELRAVAIRDAAAVLFVGMSRDAEGEPPAFLPTGESRLDGDQLLVSAAVVQGTSSLGSVQLLVTIEPVARRLVRYGVIALMVVMASLVVAVLGLAQAAMTRANTELAARAGDLSVANANLRIQIEERAKAEEALRQSQKMEAIGQLSGGMAHDFNNLLAAVLGNLELLRKRVPDDPRARRLLDGAIQGAERGAALTQRLLAFARRQDLRPGRVDVPDLVSGMADLLQRSIGPLVAIETRFPIRLPPVHVDANQLELAIVNLVVNARDAMPDGGALTISAQTQEIGAADAGGLAAGSYLRLSVTDTGEGMDAATLARAMEPFFTTKGVGKGTGLGLSMVHGMAAQSGGRLLLHSRPAEGTTAELWLPVAPGPTDLEPVPEPAEIRPDSTPPAVRPLSILVVDDDALVRLGTVAMLEDLGHRVLEATSGAEAMTVLRQSGPVDLVLTDQAMPQMLGTELAALIRDSWPGLPVMLVTGYAEPTPDEGPGLPKLGKPFHQHTLATAIADCMRARGGDAPGGRHHA